MKGMFMTGKRFRYVVFTSLTMCVVGSGLWGQPIPSGTPIEEPDPENWAMLRMFNTVRQGERWQAARDLVERLSAVRAYVAELPTAGNPISDRYVLTCYAGAVDMRHFLYTAIKVLTSYGDRRYWKAYKYCPGSIDDAWLTFKVSPEIIRNEGELEYHIQRALYDTFRVEYGPEFERLQVENPVELNKRVKERYWQATTEDFPSSALGALFAKYYLLDKVDQLDLDLIMEFTRFILPFRPVPDQIRTKMSYDEFVKGFRHAPDGNEKAIDDESLEDHLFIHFTAVPINNTRLINKVAEQEGYGKFCEDVDDPAEGLKKAGVKVVDVAYKYPLELEYLEPKSTPVWKDHAGGE